MTMAPHHQNPRETKAPRLSSSFASAHPSLFYCLFGSPYPTLLSLWCAGSLEDFFEQHSRSRSISGLVLSNVTVFEYRRTRCYDFMFSSTWQGSRMGSHAETCKTPGGMLCSDRPFDGFFAVHVPFFVWIICLSPSSAGSLRCSCGFVPLAPCDHGFERSS